MSNAFALVEGTPMLLFSASSTSAISQLNDWSEEDGTLTIRQLAEARDVLVHAVQRKDCRRCTLGLDSEDSEVLYM